MKKLILMEIVLSLKEKKMLKKVYWLAVHPTPYNYYLYTYLRTSKIYEFQFCYSEKQKENLLFDYRKISFDDDYYFDKVLGVDVRLLLKCFSKDSIFVVVGWEDRTKILIMLIRKLLGLPYAFWTDSVNPIKTKKSILIYIKRSLLSHANVVFTTGEFGIAKMLESELLNNKNKLVSLPFFVDIPNEFDEKSIDYPNEPMKILTLARLVKGKGLENSIKAIKILKSDGYNVQLSIGGVGNLYDQLEKLIIELDLKEIVRLTGWLDSDNLIKARQENHILLHAVDSHDPYPLAVLESMAYGLPIIGTDQAGSIADRVVNGFNGYVIHDTSPLAIATSIKLLININNLNYLSINARNTALKWPGSKGLNIVEAALFKIR